MLHLNSAWSLTQTDNSRGLNGQTKLRRRTAGFWKLQSLPHVRIVSVIVLWMMRPLLISFHSSLLPFLFFFFFFFHSFASPRILIKHLCQCVSVGLSLFFHVLIYRLISADSTVSPCVFLHHHEKLNQTTTLPKAPLTCFNSWPNFSWPAEEMWSAVDHPPSWAMCWRTQVEHVLEHRCTGQKCI